MWTFRFVVIIIFCLCISFLLCIVSSAHLFGYDLCNEHVMISVIINDMRFASIMVLMVVFILSVYFSLSPTSVVHAQWLSLWFIYFKNEKFTRIFR